MRRIFFTGVVMFFLFTISCYAGIMRVENIKDADENTSIGIGSTATVYTMSFPIKSGETFGLAYKLTSASTQPNITLQLEESYTKPTTEGSSDSNWVIPDSMSDIGSSITTETLHIKTISPVAMPYARIKILNHQENTDPVITLKIISIEKE